VLTLEQLPSGRWTVTRDGAPFDGDFATAGEALAAGQADPEPIVASAATLEAPTQPCTGCQDCADCTDCAQAPLVAGAAPNVPDSPPAEWFADPGFTDDTTVPFYDVNDRGERISDTPYARGCPLTITADGQVYGHLASWGTCHVGFEGQCITPPRSPSGYAYFRTGEVVTASGERVPVGALTVNTGHAATDVALSASQAAAHYDNTGTCAALVACGEDPYGIWVAGTIRPGASAEQVQALQKLSGDWRAVRGQLELVAALAVNVPGFPVPRYSLAAAAMPVRQTVEDGQTVALIAAGSAGLARAVDQPWTRDIARLEAQVADLLRLVGPNRAGLLASARSAASSRARAALEGTQ
jgi:hypothetical protein